MTDYRQYPTLTFEEEKELHRLYMKEGDDAALEKLVLANMKNVTWIAYKYRNKGIPDDELLAIATEGLMRAVHKHDYATGAKLFFYAQMYTKQRILLQFRYHNSVIKHLDFRTQWYKKHGKITFDYLDAAQEDTGDNEKTGHIMLCPDQEKTINDLILTDDRRFLRQVIGTFTEEEQMLLQDRIYDGLTFKAIAARLNMTIPGVRHRYFLVVNKLKRTYYKMKEIR